MLTLSVSHFFFPNPHHQHHGSSSPAHGFGPCILSGGRNSREFRHRRRVVLARKSDEVNESVFMDENGVVNDMERYMNYLSLEYESVWDTKPSWCQPWTITLTGALVIAGSWIVLHSVGVTGVVSFLICTWWYIFLYSYPKAYAEMIAERRKRVTSGAEDTYGMKKSD